MASAALSEIRYRGLNVIAYFAIGVLYLGLSAFKFTLHDLGFLFNLAIATLWLGMALFMASRTFARATPHCLYIRTGPVRREQCIPWTAIAQTLRSRAGSFEIVLVDGQSVRLANASVWVGGKSVRQLIAVLEQHAPLVWVDKV